MKLRTITIPILLFLLAPCPSSWAQVVLVDTPEQPLPAEQRLEHACQFYGLNITQVSVPNDQTSTAIRNALKQNEGRAIIFTTRALDNLDVNDIKDILVESPEKKIPVLIVGITADSDLDTLRKWSGNSLIGHANTKSKSAKGLYNISAPKEISHQLSELDFPIAFEEINYLVLDGTAPMQNLIRIRLNNEEDSFPVFVRTLDDKQEVFLHTQVKLSRSSAKLEGRFDTEYFLEIAPLVMFLRYSCGQLCWHSPGHYANLTIDDPWLTEPYGHLSYKGLAQQMDKANFHLTIAFIPWNYDRSEKAVVSLFKNRPDRFSICFHGNDHDHYEF